MTLLNACTSFCAHMLRRRPKLFRCDRKRFELRLDGALSRVSKLCAFDSRSRLMWFEIVREEKFLWYRLRTGKVGAFLIRRDEAPG